MLKASAALGLLILSTSSALADCDPGANVTLIRDRLPLSANPSERAMASLALPYAAMILYVKTPLSPPGFQRGPSPSDVLPGGGKVLAALTDFDPAVFISCTARAAVIVFDGLQDYNARDYLSAALRRAGGGYSSLAVTYTAAVMAALPGYDLSVIGHSAGGDVASIAAGAFGLPSITFNAAPSEASVAQNDGAQQLNIVVNGDPISDRPQTLRGRMLYLDMPGERPHQILTVIDGLLALAAD